MSVCLQAAGACGGRSLELPEEGTDLDGNGLNDRAAAAARAELFVADDRDCTRRKRASVVNDPTSEYLLRMVQYRTPGSQELCRSRADRADAWKCDAELDCGSDAWMRALDWSQWHPGATVLEVTGLRAEQVNLVHTRFGEFPVPFDYSSPAIELYPFYQTPLADEVPPGCHYCGYWWYLDPTATGVALVLSPAMARDLEEALPAYHLELCLTD